MYNKDERALIWLNNFIGVSTKKKHFLLELFDTPDEMFCNFKDRREHILEFIDEKTYNQMAMLNEESFVDKIVNDLSVKNVKVITIESKNYPERLQTDLLEPPICLYYKGNIELLSSNMSIGIVGARKVTRYGRDVTEKFSRELTLNGFCIISGMARGVDTIAQTECIENDGKTIAVLGSGIDVIYPKENRDLYNNIVEKGLVLSEYPLGTEPYPYNFPQRNRIISALSDGVLVTEAGAKSGSIITANLALEMGRDIYAVPGNIFSEQSQGTNELIKISNNVTMTTNVNDILKNFNIKAREIVEHPIQLDFVEQSIVFELSNGKLHFEEIMSKTNIELSSLFVALQGLENAKIIRKLPGNFYELQPK